MSLDPTITRRCVLGTGAMACAGTVLVACGSDDDPDEGSTDPTATGGSESPAGGDGGNGGGDGGGAALVALGDVPVGGAVVVKGGPDGNVVVAQPEEGQVVAYTAKCTHKGGTVAVVGDKLQCPLHQSEFNWDTGEVLKGPAEEPLPEVTVMVEGDEVVTG